MKIDTSKYLEFFFSEVIELLTLLNQQLIELEKDFANEKVINEIFRITHTIKGNSAAMGFDIISSFAHSLENVFDKVRRNELEFTSDIADVVFDAIDQLANDIHELHKTGKEPPKLPPIIQQLDKIVKGEKVKREALVKTDLEKTIKLTESVRVSLKKLDLMINLIGEMLIDISRLENLNEALANRHLKDIIVHLRRAIVDAQYNMMNVRLVPLASILEQFPRMVRDLAQQENKKINIELEGTDIELDSKVVEKLKTPLIQMVRNAVSHGIEPPAPRDALGKDTTGLIKITADRQKDRVVISISDDGRGINPANIATKAVELGIITMEKASELSEEEMYELIFESGFTTVKEATQISGRGVGMDAVRSELSSAGGTMSMSSILGEGTTFTIDVPLSIAVIRALLCSSAGKTIAFPTSLIEELQQVAPDKVNNMSGKPHLLVDEELVPVYDLANVLYNFPTEHSDGDKINLVMIRVGAKRVAFLVEKYIKEEDIVVKSFWMPCDVRSISGATILGDGKIALIIDPHETVKYESLK